MASFVGGLAYFAPLLMACFLGVQGQHHRHPMAQQVSGFVAENLETLYPQEIDEVAQKQPMTLVYFEKSETFKSFEFLETLDDSVDYLNTMFPAIKGTIRIYQVNCEDSQNSNCKSDVPNNVVIFRKGKTDGMPIDLPCDRNAIVASILHLAFIDEVPILQTKEERQTLEQSCYSKCDILLLYLPQTEAPEYRVFMETAYKEKDSYHFAVVTTLNGTEGLSPFWSEDAGTNRQSPRLWYLFCKKLDKSDERDSCEYTLLQDVINTTQVQRFLEMVTMEPWYEASFTEEGRLESPLADMDVPKVLLVYCSSTRDGILQIARELASEYRTAVGIHTVDIAHMPEKLFDTVRLQKHELHSPSVIFLHPNVSKGAVVSEGIGDAVEFVKAQYLTYREEQEEKSDGDSYLIEDLLVQDDPMAVAVHLIEKTEECLVPVLTENTVKRLFNHTHVAVVLFHLNWDPVSNLVSHMFSQLMSKYDFLSQKPGILSKLDCYDWDAACNQRNITIYPTIHIYRQHHQKPFVFEKQFSVENIFNAIVLHYFDNPVILKSRQDFLDFLEGQGGFNWTRHFEVIIFGVFHQENTAGQMYFTESASHFEGRYIYALCSDDAFLEAKKFFELAGCFVAVYRRRDGIVPYSILREDITAETIDEFVASRETLTIPAVDMNLISAATKDNRLLAIVIMTEEALKQRQKILLNVRHHMQHMNITLCWLCSTSKAGSDVLESFEIHTEPALVLLNKAKAAYYIYDGKTWHPDDIIAMARNAQAGSVEISGSLKKTEWRPRQPDIDYLEKMKQDATLGEPVESEDTIKIDGSGRIPYILSSTQAVLSTSQEHGRFHTEL